MGTEAGCEILAEHWEFSEILHGTGFICLSHLSNTLPDNRVPEMRSGCAF